MFETPGESYDRHIGRYSGELARGLIGLAGIEATHRVLDVGCGTGLLTAKLADVVGAERVSAVDLSESFVDACRRRVPDADVRVASADALPFADSTFDAAVSQLVLNFVPDPDAAVSEMGRVTRPGGVVAACVWDYAGEMTLLRAFWDAAAALDPAAAAQDEGARMGLCRPDVLRAVWTGAGLTAVEEAELRPSVRYADFEELWSGVIGGAGPAGAYAVALDADGQAALRAEMHRRLGSPEGPFTLDARAWAIAGRR